MENSILTVHVVQAEELRANLSENGSNSLEPFVILTIENQKIETRAATDNTHSPIWDERFTFEIETGQEDLQVFVVNKDIYATNEAIGKVDVSLNFLRDQMKHDEWFDLELLQGHVYEGSAGAVHLIL